MTSCPRDRPAKRLGPGHRPRYLRRLPTPARSAARNGTPAGSRRRWTDHNPYDAGATGVWFNRVHGFEVGRGRERAHRAFSEIVLALRGRACVTVCPTGASYKRAEDGIVLVDEHKCIGCKLCAWAAPTAHASSIPTPGDEEVHAVHRPHLQSQPRGSRSRAACVAACPVSARHFGDLGDPIRMSRSWWPSARGVDLGTRDGLPPDQQVPAAAAQAGRAGEPGRDLSSMAAPRVEVEGLFLRWVDRLFTR